MQQNYKEAAVEWLREMREELTQDPQPWMEGSEVEDWSRGCIQIAYSPEVPAEEVFIELLSLSRAAPEQEYFGLLYHTPGPENIYRLGSYYVPRDNLGIVRSAEDESYGVVLQRLVNGE